MASYDLCIDMGSSWTTIYKKNSGVVLREPSVMLMSNTGKNLKLLSVGLQAQKYCGKLSNDQVKVKVKLESTAGTGTFYLAEKNPRTHPEKLTLKKYDKK